LLRIFKGISHVHLLILAHFSFRNYQGIQANNITRGSRTIQRDWLKLLISIYNHSIKIRFDGRFWARILFETYRGRCNL